MTADSPHPDPVTPHRTAAAFGGLEFGIYVPQIVPDYETLAGLARTAERTGFGTLWLFDHLYAPGLPDHPALEAWTTATALLAHTTTLRVGTLVLCNNFRHPVLLARMATTLDLISGGRLEFGLGSGSVPEEHRQAGLPWGSAAERSERQAEATMELFAAEVMPQLRAGAIPRPADAAPPTRPSSPSTRSPTSWRRFALPRVGFPVVTVDPTPRLSDATARSA
ncbi:LLM class flavin-dependent oxidoreductase [Nocardia asiatica]|uniref:LLM class flavin-dependent oxidoreductase n=1 Tax=Nocardia asiatica TaxID=209252 RepID=UPI00030660D3|nr:LLM class flavin-dependent oxidoreductase [Nocardia asiatica]